MRRFYKALKYNNRMYEYVKHKILFILWRTVSSVADVAELNCAIYKHTPSYMIQNIVQMGNVHSYIKLELKFDFKKNFKTNWVQHSHRSKHRRSCNLKSILRFKDSIPNRTIFTSPQFRNLIFYLIFLRTLLAAARFLAHSTCFKAVLF